jgi:dimethylaniline monooxygenase (N-oxide forming)
VIHSSQYKKREEFKGRKVLILGVSSELRGPRRTRADDGWMAQIGETSMDLSYEAIQGGAKEIVVCHRGGSVSLSPLTSGNPLTDLENRFLSFPKVLNDFQVFGFKFDGDLPIDGLLSTSRFLRAPREANEFPLSQITNCKLSCLEFMSVKN